MRNDLEWWQAGGGRGRRGAFEQKGKWERSATVTQKLSMDSTWPGIRWRGLEKTRCCLQPCGTFTFPHLNCSLFFLPPLTSWSFSFHFLLSSQLTMHFSLPSVPAKWGGDSRVLGHAVTCGRWFGRYLAWVDDITAATGTNEQCTRHGRCKMYNKELRFCAYAPRKLTVWYDKRDAHEDTQEKQKKHSMVVTLCANLARLQCPAVWSNTYLDIAVKVSGCVINIYNQLTLRKADDPQ